MDPWLLCTNDPQWSVEPLTDDQTGELVQEPVAETISVQPIPTENYTTSNSTKEKGESESLDNGDYSKSVCLAPSQKADFTGPCVLEKSKPKSFSLSVLSNDFIQTLPSTTELREGLETSKKFNSVEVSAPLSDLYIFESNTQDFILTHTADPHKIICPAYQAISQSTADQVCVEHVPKCYLEGIETQCQSSFRKQRVSENVSQTTQCDELRAPALDAWGGLDWMSEKDVRSGKAEVLALTLQRQRSESPAELWLDACQYLTGEEAEDKEVLDHQAVSKSLQESDYNPSDSRRVGWAPVKRWSSVDSWASALSDWTGIIEDPPEEITAAFTEIGAEIEALTQALQEVTTHLETETLQGDPRATEVEQKQQTMGVQDQPLKTPETYISSEQSCLSLSFEAPRPEHLNRGAFQHVELLRSCEGELGAEELQSSNAEPSPSSALQNISAGLSFVGPDCLDLPQFDRYSKSSELIELKITEDVNAERELGFEKFYHQAFGDDRCKVLNECNVHQQGSATKEQIKGNPSKTDPSISSAHVHKKSDEPGVDIQTDPPKVGASKVNSDSSKLIMCLAPLSGISGLNCQTRKSLEGDQGCIKTLLSDCICFGHVQDCTPFPTLGGITNKQLLECHEELIHKRQNSITIAEKLSSDELLGLQVEENVWPFLSETEKIDDLARFAVFHGDHLFVSEKDRVACITLGLNDPFHPWNSERILACAESEQTLLKMPHKTCKTRSDSKTRSKKEKSSGHHHAAQAPKKQESTSQQVSKQQTRKQHESHPTVVEYHLIENGEAKEAEPVMEIGVGTEKGKTHGKKKKKHGHKTTVKQETEASINLEHGAKPKTSKGKVDIFEAKFGIKSGKAQWDENQSVVAETQTQKPGETGTQLSDRKELINDKVVKKRRVSGDKFGKILSVLESKQPKADASVKAKGAETQTEITTVQKKAYSEVVKQMIPPKEGPKVVEPIQARPVSGDPQSMCLWCQFAEVHSDYTVFWSRDGSPLAQFNRSAGDESRVSLIISNTSNKDLGQYMCQLSSSHGSVCLGYEVTYEVLSEIGLPTSPKIISSMPEELCGEEEDAHCSRLLFKDDFLSDQYFGENHPISILTEKLHFGEGMHRRAFRTKLKAGQIPLLVPGHSCVLKVHNAISYGTKNNDDLVQKNFNLAKEECHVQNTAREYIKAYTSAALSVEAFGDVPEIIPIYLVHRPSNNIPYATLEEELIGDFVKYSVKDGKEINMKRRDSEAGQKCCAFQHWVYHNTEGNLLVTDMQGVGMKLTDVGIATSKKGYKGFKGNCATSFIDQFKALHQCNKYCEILGLKSLQPKPKKVSSAPKPKVAPSAVPKKKTFGQTVKNKS